MSVALGLGLMIALLVIGILGMSVFGIINIANGKHEWAQIGTFLIPALVFVVSYFVLGSLTEAGMVTMLLALATMVLFIVISGARSTLKL
ncbi:MAG: hypothetical protein WD491_03100 [Balneolales bacterium]